MDFKSFQKSRKDPIKTEINDQEDLRRKAQEYTNKSDPELLSEILKEARKQKSKGVFSDEKLEEFVTKVSPMLNADQQQRLSQAIKMIKGD